MLASEEIMTSIAASLASLDAKTPAWSMALTTALASKLIVKAAAGKIRSASGRLDTSAPSGTYYLQLWDLANVPADTTVVSTTNVKMAPQKIIHVNGVRRLKVQC